jgi:hypothetical protein
MEASHCAPLREILVNNTHELGFRNAVFGTPAVDRTRRFRKVLRHNLIWDAGVSSRRLDPDSQRQAAGERSYVRLAGFPVVTARANSLKIKGDIAGHKTTGCRDLFSDFTPGGRARATRSNPLNQISTWVLVTRLACREPARLWSFGFSERRACVAHPLYAARDSSSRAAAVGMLGPKSL